jgi:hypothetical protein
MMSVTATSSTLVMVTVTRVTPYTRVAVTRDRDLSNTETRWSRRACSPELLCRNLNLAGDSARTRRAAFLAIGGRRARATIVSEALEAGHVGAYASEGSARLTAPPVCLSAPRTRAIHPAPGAGRGPGPGSRATPNDSERRRAPRHTLHTGPRASTRLIARAHAPPCSPVPTHRQSPRTAATAAKASRAGGRFAGRPAAGPAGPRLSSA